MRLEQFQSIINDLDVGNSVAENDNLLESARVETAIFWDVYKYGKYDIISVADGVKSRIETFVLLLCLYLSIKFVTYVSCRLCRKEGGSEILNKTKDTPNGVSFVTDRDP